MPESLDLPPKDTVTQLLIDERGAIQAQDLTTLANLWTDDARIIDGRGTTHRQDDYIWQGKPAILDRYVVAVFPNPPPTITAKDIQIENLEINLAGDVATLTTHGDRWIFWRNQNRWLMRQLIYRTP